MLLTYEQVQSTLSIISESFLNSVIKIVEQNQFQLIKRDCLHQRIRTLLTFEQVVRRDETHDDDQEYKSVKQEQEEEEKQQEDSKQESEQESKEESKQEYQEEESILLETNEAKQQLELNSEQESQDSSLLDSSQVQDSPFPDSSQVSNKDLQSLSYSKRVQMLQYAIEHSEKAAQKRFRVPFKKIRKSKKIIKKQNYKHIYIPYDKKLEKKMIKWFLEMCQQRKPLTREIICLKAKSLSTNRFFQSSYAWIYNFIRRNPKIMSKVKGLMYRRFKKLRSKYGTYRPLY